MSAKSIPNRKQNVPVEVDGPVFEKVVKEKTKTTAPTIDDRVVRDLRFHQFVAHRHESYFHSNH